MIVSAEVPHLQLRDKTLTVSYLLSFVWEFGVSFSLPYLLYAPYADLESKVGFIYGSIAFIGIAWAWFCLPETRGRSLEEMEELWQENVPANRFNSYVTKSTIGLRVSQLERHAGTVQVFDSAEDLKREEDEEKEIVVYHEEVSETKKG